jgi:hypothetical protein
MDGDFSFYSPEHRWVAAGLAAKSASNRPSDLIIGRVAAFLRLSPEQAAKRDPELAAVVALNRQAIVADLKILAISGMFAEDIAARTMLPLPHVKLWQEVFFDVSDRLGAQGWVVHFVIDPERQAGNRLLAERLRIAYSGGPVAAELLVRERGGGQLTCEERVCILQLRFNLKLAEALAMPLSSPSQAARVFEAAARLRQSEAEVQLAKERLALQERQAQRCHDEYMQRLRNEYAKTVATKHSFEIVTNEVHADWTADPADYSGVISVFTPHEWEAAETVSQLAADNLEGKRGGHHGAAPKDSEPIVERFPTFVPNATEAAARPISA